MKLPPGSLTIISHLNAEKLLRVHRLTRCMMKVNFRVHRFKNYREVFDSKKCSVESDGATYTLRIRNVDFADGGDIECQARNRYGAVSIRAKLTVLGRAQSLFGCLLWTALTVVIQNVRPGTDMELSPSGERKKMSFVYFLLFNLWFINVTCLTYMGHPSRDLNWL